LLLTKKLLPPKNLPRLSAGTAYKRARLLGGAAALRHRAGPACLPIGRLACCKDARKLCQPVLCLSHCLQRRTAVPRSQTFPTKSRGRRAAALALLSLGDDVAIAAVTHGRWAAGRAALLGPKGIVLGCALGLVTGLGWIAIDRLRKPRRSPASDARDEAFPKAP
jgi:hypothetical protein